MESKHLTFRRLVDGVIGVGFILKYSGVEMASIAWPDREANKVIGDDYERNGIELVEPLKSGIWFDESPRDVGAEHGGLGIGAASPEDIAKLQPPADPVKVTVLTPDEAAAILTPPTDGYVGPGELAEDITIDGETLPAGTPVEVTADGGQVIPATPPVIGESGDSITKTDDSITEPPTTASETVADDGLSEADRIRIYLHEHGTGTANKAVIAALAQQGIKITTQQVSQVKADLKKTAG